MRFKRLLLVGVLCLVSAACSKSNASLIDEAKEKASEDLIDPTSPLFSNLAIGKNERHGFRYVCGSINAKNRFGAYTGQKNFAVYFDKNDQSESVHWEDDLVEKSTTSAMGASVTPQCMNNWENCDETELQARHILKDIEIDKIFLENFRSFCSETTPF